MSYIEETGIQGRTTVRFIVTKTGEIKNVKAIRGDRIMCDSLVSVIKRMPRWIPGKQNGETVYGGKKEKSKTPIY
ncbi:MAG: energy transducer TonB [Dysgonomonas sp.]